MQKDPGQLINLFDDEDAASVYSLSGRPFGQIVNRLDALMMVLKSCRGESCIKPWKVLHPEGDIATLKDAMSQTFDTFYKTQPKVEFTSCELGYMIEAEGPQDPNVLGSGRSKLELREQGAQGSAFKYSGHWSHWT